jgi:hypothetical protein
MARKMEYERKFVRRYRMYAISANFRSPLQALQILHTPIYDRSSMTTLHDFVAWTHQHIKGDEKGEAQVFLDRFFRPFGWEGGKEAGMKPAEDVLEFLLTLNRECAAREARGEVITPPGLPAAFAGEASAFVSDDCVRVV